MLAGILVAAPNASGQAAVDQYIPSPGPEGVTNAPSGGGGDTGGDTAEVAGGAAGAGREKTDTQAAPKPENEGTSAGVELPLGDGYDLTPFVAIIAGLLVLALVGGLFVTMKRGGGPARQE